MRKLMPAMFIGHGSPMNAISENAFTQTLSKISEQIGKPDAILCISAHWLTRGTFVTNMLHPKLIYDFSGFPDELYEVKYPAVGSPKLAGMVKDIGSGFDIKFDDHDWGLDHGTWSILKHIYPKANIPVVQLSIDITKSAEFHYSLGSALKALREQNILLIASGNIVHNLSAIEMETEAKPYSWAIEFDSWFAENLEKMNTEVLIKNYQEGPFGKKSIPTPDHYYPLLYILGSIYKEERCSTLFSGIQNGSIAMRSFMVT